MCLGKTVKKQHSSIFYKILKCWCSVDNSFSGRVRAFKILVTLENYKLQFKSKSRAYYVPEIKRKLELSKDFRMPN